MAEVCDFVVWYGPSLRRMHDPDAPHVRRYGRVKAFVEVQEVLIGPRRRKVVVTERWRETTIWEQQIAGHACTYHELDVLIDRLCETHPMEREIRARMDLIVAGLWQPPRYW